MNRRSIVEPLFLVTLLLTAAGCATEQPERSYVQELALRKDAFAGDWYGASTVVDAPYEADWAFEGLQGATHSIRWKIEKDYLYAYRIHELCRGADHEVERVGAQNYEGEPIAAYKILSHFDIRRRYNSVNGEEYNIIEENTQDRLWNEREYIRVDWSKNLIQSDAFASIKADPVDFFVESKYDKWAPKFLDDDNDGKFDYIDVVTRLTLSSDNSTQVSVRYSFKRKIDEDYEIRFHPDDEFEHFSYFRTSLEGGLTYDLQRGETDFLDHFMYRHNLWEKSHQDGPEAACVRDLDCRQRFGQSVCDPGVKRCTIPYRERTPRPIVYHTNALYPWDRPLFAAATQHIENGWNRSFQMTINELLHGNQKLIACVDDGEEGSEPCCTRAERQQEAGLAFDDPARRCVVDLFQLRPNSCSVERVRGYLEAHPELQEEVKTALAGLQGAVVGDDLVVGHHDLPEVCAATETASRNAGIAPPFTWEQLGDIRYNMVNWVVNPSRSSPLGYGPSNADARTGQIVSATANVYGGAVDSYEGFILDILELVDGTVPEDRFLNGESMREYYQSIGGSTGMPTVPQVFLPKDFGLDQAGVAQAFQALRSRGRELEALDHQVAFGSGSQGLAGTYLEDLLLNDELLLAHGYAPGTPLTEEVREQISPFRQEFSRRLMQQEHEAHGKTPHACILERNEYTDFAVVNLIAQARREAKGDCAGAYVSPDEYVNVGQPCQAGAPQCAGNNVCEAGSCQLDPAVAARLAVVRGDTQCREELLQHVIAKVFRGVTEHELGHTLGLRHNFEGSFDAEGFADRYWEILRRHPLPDPEQGRYSGDGLPYDRVKLDQDGNRIEGQDRMLDDEEYHRYWLDYQATRNQQELEGRDKYMLSSIMDYGGQFYSDFSGIGKYDHAAIKFGYGNLREYFDPKDINYQPETGAQEEQKPAGIRRRLNTPYYLGGEVCSRNEECPHFDPLVYQKENYRPERPSLSLQTVTQTCGAKVLKPDNSKIWVPLDWPGYGQGPRGFCSNWDEDMVAAGVSFPRHRMCSDERVLDRPFCNRWDEGASSTEIVENMIEMYDRMYPFNNFRRYRRSFTELSYLQRIYQRYFFVIGKQHQSMIWRMFYLRGFDADSGPGGFKDMLTASIMGMNFFGRVLATPPVGPYRRYPGTDVLRICGRSDEVGSCSYWSNRPASDFDSTLGNGGKYQWSVFETGYYGAIERQAQFGTFNDKVLALMSLSTRSWASVGGNDESIPLNYYDCYGDSLLDLFSGIITEDFRQYAPVVVFDEAGTRVDHLRQRDYWYGTFFGQQLTPEGRRDSLLPGRWVNHDPLSLAEEVEQSPQLSFLDPDMSIIHRIYALDFALGSFSAFFNTNFADYVQLKRYDATWDPVEDENPVNPVIEYRSPLRGRIYRAVQTFDHQSITAALVEQAVAAKTEYDLALGTSSEASARNNLDSIESFLNIAADLIEITGISY